MLVIPLDVEPDDEDPRQALPFFHLFVDGRPVRVLLDSGAVRTAIAAPPGTPTRSIPSAGTGTFGLPADDARLWSTSISIGDTPIGTFEIEDVPASARFNVGQDVLARFRCHYRLAERELILDGPESPRSEEIYLDPAEHVYLKARW